jgi:hypothetical protein
VPASPSSADKPETAAPPPISPQAHSAPAGSSSSPTDPADKDDPRRDLHLFSQRFFQKTTSKLFSCPTPARRRCLKTAAENSAEKRNESRDEENEENKKRRTHTTAGHKLKRYFAPARRSAHVKFQ